MATLETIDNGVVTTMEQHGTPGPQGAYQRRFLRGDRVLSLEKIDFMAAYGNRPFGARASADANASTKTTIFVDGLNERTQYPQIRKLFEKHGIVVGVYVQRRRKINRKFKCGFVRFKCEKETTRAIQALKGKLLHGATIKLCVAKFPLLPKESKPIGNGFAPPKSKSNNQLWRAKRKTEVIRRSEVCVLIGDESRDRIEKTTIATLSNIYNMEDIRKFLITKGLSMVKEISVGPYEVALEFPSKEEQSAFLSRGNTFLCSKFNSVRQEKITSTSCKHYFWLSLRKITIGAWHESFFRSIAGHFGKFICMDDATKERQRYDVALILISSSLPVINLSYVDAQVDEETDSVAVESYPCFDFSVSGKSPSLSNSSSASASLCASSDAVSATGSTVVARPWVSDVPSL